MRYHADILGRRTRIPGHLGEVVASQDFSTQRELWRWVAETLSMPAPGLIRTAYLYKLEDDVHFIGVAVVDESHIDRYL